MKKYIFLLISLVTIGLTTYFSLLPLNGVSQADVSNLYLTSITPAGFTFSIWSLIYLSWLYLGVQMTRGKVKAGKSSLQFACAIALTALWLIPWHFLFVGTSFLVMLLILSILLFVYTKKKYKRDFQYVLELTLGWILVATLANLHVFLLAYELYFSPVVFTIISLLLGSYISLHFLRQNNSFIPGFVFIWALVGIIFGQDNNSIQIVSSLCILALGSNMLLKTRLSQKIKKKKK